MKSDSKYLWQPRPEEIERTNVWRFMRKHRFTDREAFLRWSVEHLEEFWAAIVDEMKVEWFQRYTQVLDTSRGVEWPRWFVGGTLNVAHNCLDRWANTDRTAIVWEGEDGSVREVGFRELAQDVTRVVAAFTALGLQQGDRVAVCLPMTPEVVTVLYACARLGLVMVPIFSGYGAGAIQTRLADSGARLLVTSDAIQRRGKVGSLKVKIEPALAGTAVEKVIVWRYRGIHTPMQEGRDLWWHELPAASDAAETLALDSEAPLLLIYTSGTTGKPKGTVHTHAGALAQMAKEIYLGFDHQETDRFFWLTDIGWMMGPWAIVGNHQFGGTLFLYDGAPDYPAADRLWAMIERHRLTVFGVSPTAIRLLMRSPLELVTKHDLSSLRLLGSTGEPWDDTSYRWHFEHVGGGRCPIINISGGTEIVGSFLHPLPIQALTSCTLGGPAPGMATEVVDEQGVPVRGRKGYLVCTKPTPSMTRGLWGDPERYIETYWSRFPGMWNHGDWASVDEEGLWYLHGRADESLKVAGRKVGPAEVEDACTAHPGISEAAVIGIPDELTGEAIVAFVVPKPGQTMPAAVEVEQTIVQNLGPTLRPKVLRFVKELPKTQSGKIVRRAIRQKYLGEPVGDLSTVANPEVLDQFA